MMGKLMIDSVATWATQYRIDSFRFDLMAHQPRAVMEELRRVVNRAAGREVQLIGEGWNFGEVANGARFVQAPQLSLNVGRASPPSATARATTCAAAAMTAGEPGAQPGRHQRPWYDDNGSGAGKTKTDLMWSADMVRSAGGLDPRLHADDALGRDAEA